MAKKEEKRQKYNFFDFYPNNPSLAQYLQDLTIGRFERTSDDPQGSVWGTYKLATENASQEKPNQGSHWFRGKNDCYSRLDSSRSSSNVTNPAPVVDESLPSRPLPVFVGPGAVRAMPSGVVHFNQGARPVQHTFVHGNPRVLLACNPPEMSPNPPIFPLRSSFGGGIKKMISQAYACEKRHEYNKLFEEFVADTTPLSPTKSTTDVYESSHRELPESQNFTQGTKELNKATTMVNPNLHDINLDYQSSTVASSVTPLQSDPSSTVERSDAEESSCNNYSPVKKATQDTISSKDNEAHELSFPRLADTQSVRNPKKIHFREMRSRPTFRDDSFTLNLNRRPCRKTSSPSLHISTSSLSPEFQTHLVHHRNGNESSQTIT